MKKLNWVKLFIWLLIVIPAIVFVVVSLSITFYMYGPRSYKQMKMPVLQTNIEHFILSVHGLGDNKETWSEPLQRQQQLNNPDAQVEALDWNPYAQSTFRCSVDGLRIGKLIGEHLARGETLQSVHLIGHSCGSFVILGVCDALKARQPTIKVQTTYLDPVSIYGGFFWHYGIGHFGSCADFSEAYIDTVDTVPGSNQLLPNTHTFDVTKVRVQGQIDISPHVWPTVYYQRLNQAGKAPSLNKQPDLMKKYPLGELEIVNPK